MRPVVLRALIATMLAPLMPVAPLFATEPVEDAVSDVEGSAADDVIVIGQRTGYQIDETSTATRTPTRLLDTPQAITALSKQQIDDQAIRSIGEALRQVPGAIAAQGEGNRDQIVLRGQNTTADFFVDGVRDDVQYYRPLYNLDRLEVLRGPNAMTFGRGGGGGVVNRVTKTPELATFAQGSASGDTFGAWYVDGDANVKLSEAAALRLNAVHEAFANHRDFYSGRVTAVNPTAKLFLGSQTTATLSYEFQNDARDVDRGVPSRRPDPSRPGRPITGFRDTFFGIPGFNRTEFTGHVARATATHAFTPRLSVTTRLVYGNYDKYYQNAFPSGAAGDTTVPIQAYFDETLRDNLFSQTDLVWKAETGPVSHVILAGVEFGEQITRNGRLNGFFTGAGASNDGLTVTVPLADPVAIPLPALSRAGSGARLARTRATIAAGYIQDQLKYGPVELLVGVRYDSFALDATNRLNGQQLSRDDRLWSPRAGLVVHPVGQASLYFSYARSYLPQSGDQFTALDLTSAALIPERFDNYEVGAKWEPRAGLLIAASLYQLERTNTRATGAQPGTIVLTGAQRSRGLEVEARGQIGPRLNLSVAYALTDARIVSTTSAAAAGQRVGLVPRHTVSAFGRYDATKRFGVGLGVSYFSDRFTTISNNVTLPAYARVDAALYYKLTDRIEAQVNVENLFDAGYFPTAHNDNNISTGAPINARATLRFRL